VKAAILGEDVNGLSTTIIEAREDQDLTSKVVGRAMHFGRSACSRRPSRGARSPRDASASTGQQRVRGLIV